MAAAQRRNLTRPIPTLYAWIATIAGRETLIVIDVDSPTGSPHSLQLVAASRVQANRYATHARRYLEEMRERGETLDRVELQAFARIIRNGRAVATLRAPRPPRRP